VILNRQSFDQRAICLKRRAEINFHFNLNLNYEACKLRDRFLKFVLAIIPAKCCVQLHSYGLVVNLVEGFGCGSAKGPSPLSGRLASRTTMIPKGVQAI
jgi:hypothetical protein